MKKLKDDEKIQTDDYKYLYCNKTVTPRFYATIKIHKIDYPIRPIVSFIDSPTYFLAKYLSKLLMPSTDKATQKLKNSYQLREELDAFKIPDNHLLISYDVKSLFTSIPLSFALESVAELIDEDVDLLNRTSLQKEDLINLV